MRLRAALGAVVAAGVAALPAPPAARAAGAPVRVHAGGLAHADQTWSGYAMTGETYTSISGSWTVPALDCAAGSGSVSPWVGIDGWSDGTVEQIGLDLDCGAGKGSYHPWVEMYPAPSDYFSEQVRAGDRMTASVSVSVSGSSWTLSESDLTQGWSRTFRRTSSDRRSSAEAIVEDLGGSAAPPVDDFGTVTFTSLTVDGKAFFDAGTEHVTTLQRGSTLLSSEARLSSTSCSVTWLHR